MNCPSFSSIPHTRKKKDTERGVWKWWNSGNEKAALVRSRRTRELDQSGSWVSERKALLIPEDLPWRFLRSWSELGVALRLELRFDLSPTASHATAITHRPLISIFRPARALFDHPFPPAVHLPRLHHRHPCFFCFFIAITGTLGYSSTCVTRCSYVHTSDLDPIDRHELIVSQILRHLSPLFFCLPLSDSNAMMIWTLR